MDALSAAWVGALLGIPRLRRVAGRRASPFMLSQFRRVMARMAGEFADLTVTRTLQGGLVLVVEGERCRLETVCVFGSTDELLVELLRHGLSVRDCRWT